jgi:ATP-dependent Clp protease ATP-binding subunit ClpA
MGLKPYFEKHHELRYTNDAIKTAVELAARYINDRKLPDKAIDVIDEAGAAQHLLPVAKRRKTISPKEIEAVVAKIARIPPKNVSKDDAEVLRDLETTLKRVVFGQDKAIEALSRPSSWRAPACASRRSRSATTCSPGPPASARPRWPSSCRRRLGVELLRFDMSEYMEKHAVSRLIGAPPGYVGFDQGGLLTDGVDQHPHCVLLLDEIEKAHPDVYNILLQVMDHGKLTDHNGRQVDFRNVILIMTSNAGAAELAKSAIGFGRERREGEDTAAIERTFTPEFRNRLDAVISFAPLGQETIMRVVEKFVLQLEAQLMDRNVTFELSEEAAAWLGEKGYDDKMGARPLARVIQENVKKPLAEELLFGRLVKGGVVRVVLRDDKIELQVEESDKPRISGSKPPLLTAD